MRMRFIRAQADVLLEFLLKNLNCSHGNFGILTALALPILLVAAGGAVDVYSAFTEKANLQEKLDAGVLAAAVETTAPAQRRKIESFLSVHDDDGKSVDFKQALSVTQNADGSVTGTYSTQFAPAFLQIVGIETLPISISSTAMAAKTKGSGTCIYVLGNKDQAVLINSGAIVKAKNCGVEVSSVRNPAFIMNSGSTIDTARFCVKGTQYIKNGGTITNLQTGCDASPDPYAGKIVEPQLPASCADSGTKDGATVSLKPGLHCDVTFNGSPNVTFEPGLHIIKGRMIINSNAKVKADGVTFYFPDVDSEIRANGGLTFTASAPTSGMYKGILMFEKTSGSAVGSNTRQYVFNGSKGETLEGVIYLPNRDATYNSTTNQSNKITLVVNTMIINSANWLLEPFDSGVGKSTGAPRLVR